MSGKVATRTREQRAREKVEAVVKRMLNAGWVRDTQKQRSRYRANLAKALDAYRRAVLAAATRKTR